MRFRSSRPPTNELRAVVKIITSYVAPNNCIPWQSYPEGETSGSGAVISGRRILTNAHVVANHTVVSIQKHGCPVKYHAEVLHEAHECDLAVLTVEDDEFWKDVPELAVGEIPDLHSEITVVGYPIGGKEICVTSGIVSRIDMQHYSHSGAYLLSMQVDAAINPGNSGGPALQNGNIAGIVFQKSTTADSSGYVIPASLIQHVLADISKNGRVTGFPSIGAHCQGLEDPYMRNYYGVPQNKTGVLVRYIQPTSAAAGIVESGDVLTDIDGISISNDGMIPLRGHERINFIYHILLKHIGDPLVLGFVRKGKEMSATVNVSTIGSLVPVHAFGLRQRYFIYCGYVFIPLVQPYAHEFSDNWSSYAPRSLVNASLDRDKNHVDDEIVILSQILMDDANRGKGRYYANMIVRNVNGIPIRNLKQLVDTIDSLTQGPVLIDFEEDWRVVLDSTKAQMSERRVLKKHRIPTARSL